jgi:hypothetical protein
MRSRKKKKREVGRKKGVSEKSLLILLSDERLKRHFSLLSFLRTHTQKKEWEEG